MGVLLLRTAHVILVVAQGSGTVPIRIGGQALLRAKSITY